LNRIVFSGLERRHRRPVVWTVAVSLGAVTAGLGFQFYRWWTYVPPLGCPQVIEHRLGDPWPRVPLGCSPVIVDYFPTQPLVAPKVR